MSDDKRANKLENNIRLPCSPAANKFDCGGCLPPGCYHSSLTKFFLTSLFQVPVLRAHPKASRVVLTLPPGVPSDTVQWLSVWCRQFAVDFGHVIRTPPTQQTTIGAEAFFVSCKLSSIKLQNFSQTHPYKGFYAFHDGGGRRVSLRCHCWASDKGNNVDSNLLLTFRSAFREAPSLAATFF